MLVVLSTYHASNLCPISFNLNYIMIPIQCMSVEMNQEEGRRKNHD